MTALDKIQNEKEIKLIIKILLTLSRIKELSKKNSKRAFLSLTLLETHLLNFLSAAIQKVLIIS